MPRKPKTIHGITANVHQWRAAADAILTGEARKASRDQRVRILQEQCRLSPTARKQTREYIRKAELATLEAKMADMGIGLNPLFFPPPPAPVAEAPEPPAAPAEATAPPESEQAAIWRLCREIEIERDGKSTIPAGYDGPLPEGI